MTRGEIEKKSVDAKRWEAEEEGRKEREGRRAEERVVVAKVGSCIELIDGLIKALGGQGRGRRSIVWKGRRSVREERAERRRGKPEWRR